LEIGAEPGTLLARSEEQAHLSVADSLPRQVAMARDAAVRPELKLTSRWQARVSQCKEAGAQCCLGRWATLLDL